MHVIAGASAELLEFLQKFKRQALHAWRLSFAHPRTAEDVSFEAPLPEDMLHLIRLLQSDLEQNG